MCVEGRSPEQAHDTEVENMDNQPLSISVLICKVLGTNSWRVFSSKRFANFDFSSNFEHSFTLQTWLRLASNFAKTRFRRSPTFHFSTSKNFFETSNSRLPPKHGSDWRETLPKRVSGDPRHFIFRRQKQISTKIFGRKMFRQHPEFFVSGIEK